MYVNICALAGGGIVGTVSRYCVSRTAAGLFGSGLPWGTLAVNLTGCFLIGLFDAAARGKGLGGPHGRMLLMTGFCGAYTTFSALILELDAMMQTAPLRGAVYVLISVAAGLALFRAGALLGGA